MEKTYEKVGATAMQAKQTGSTACVATSTAKHVSRDQNGRTNENVRSSGNSNVEQDEVTECTIRSWIKGSKLGENPGQFLTRRWRAILSIYKFESEEFGIVDDNQQDNYTLHFTR